MKYVAFISAFIVWLGFMIAGALIDLSRVPLTEWPHPVYAALGCFIGLYFAAKIICAIWTPIDPLAKTWEEIARHSHSRSLLLEAELERFKRLQAETCDLLQAQQNEDNTLFKQLDDTVNSALDSAKVPSIQMNVIERIDWLANRAKPFDDFSESWLILQGTWPEVEYHDQVKDGEELQHEAKHITASFERAQKALQQIADAHLWEKYQNIPTTSIHEFAETTLKELHKISDTQTQTQNNLL